jgi:hypothetical protein
MWKVEDGISAYQLYNWCKSKDVSCYAVNIDNTLLRQIKYTSKNRNYSVLIFKINNNHLYPIEQKQLQNQIIKTGKLKKMK